MKLPRCNSPGTAGTLCNTCAFSPLNQRNMGVSTRLTPTIRAGVCQSHQQAKPAAPQEAR